MGGGVEVVAGGGEAGVKGCEVVVVVVVVGAGCVLVVVVGGGEAGVIAERGAGLRWLGCGMVVIGLWR